MYPVTPTKALRPVPTLLGGSGRIRVSTVHDRMLPALLQRPIAAALLSDSNPC